MNMKRFLLHKCGMFSAFMAGLAFLFHVGTARAEVVYGIDLAGTGIYSVDTTAGGPDTRIYPLSFGANLLVTLATRPSDGMLFYLDSLAGPNPNLWRWNPYTPSVPPVLLGTPGATTTNVIRLGFDANNVLYASNGGAAGSLWTLDQDTAAILTVLPLSGATTTQGRGDLCLRYSSGTMYVVDDGPRLYTISSTGVTTLLGTITGAAAGKSLAGCAFDSKDRLIVNSTTTTDPLFLVNTGTLVSSVLSGNTPGRAYGDLSTAPNRSADLRLTMTASNLTPGNTVSYTITVTNDGPTNTADVRVLTTLPGLSPGVTYVSSAPSTGSYTSGTGIWLVGPLFNGASATLTINTSVTTVGAKTATAQISYSDMPDPDSTPNNSVAAEDDQSSVTVTPSPDLAVVKTATSSFAVGTNATYSLSVNNLLGSAPTSGVYTLVDTLHTSLSYVSAVGTGGWSCGAVGQVVTCTNSTVIAAGASNPNAVTLTVTPGASASPSVLNTATLQNGSGSEPPSNNGNNNSTITTPVCTAGGCPDLIVNKSVTAGMAVGSVSTYTLGVTNIGGLSTGVNTYTLDDLLPAGLTLNTVPNVGATGWACPPAAPVNTVGGNRVTCTRSTAVAAGGVSPTFSFPVNVANPAAPSVTNTATVSGGGEPAAVTGNNSASVASAVTSFDLRIVKAQVVAGNFNMGVNAQYTLTVSNVGALTAPLGYTITDVLPAGLTYVSTNGGTTGWTCGVVGQTMTCSRTAPAVLGAGLSNPALTLTVTPTAAVVPSVTNTATVGYAVATESPNLLANNSSSVTTLVNAPDLIVTKSHNGNFIVGTQGTYTITVHNIGKQATTAAVVTVTDTLPAGLTYVSATGGTPWTCGAAGQVVTCTTTTIVNPNTSFAPITLRVMPTIGAAPSVSNPVSVQGGNEPANNNSNNNDNDFTYVYVTPQISKLFTPNTVVAGVPSKLTLTITNPGTNSVALTGIAVTDPFPSGMSVAAVPNFSNSCGGTVSPGQSQGDTLISLAGGGPLAVGTSCTIQVDVVSTTTGARVNTTGAVSSGNSGTGGTAAATLTVNAPASPTLTMISSPDPVGVNMPVTLTYTINNSGAANTNLGFIHNFPIVGGSQMVWLSTVSNNCTAGGASLTNPAGAALAAGTSTGIRLFNGYDAAASATCTIVITARVGNTGTVTTGNGTPGISGLTGTALLVSNVNDTFNVRGTTLTKAFSPASITTNGTSTLTFTITNGTGSPAQNGLTFTETLPALPAGFTAKSAPLATQCNGTVTAAAGGSTIALAGGNMSLGQASCTVSVDVTATAAATYTNFPANLSGLSTGMTNGIPVGGIPLTVSAPAAPALTVTKTASASPFAVGLAGQFYNVTITVANGPTTAAVALLDTLPTGITLSAAPTITGGTSTAILGGCPSSGSNITGCSIATGATTGTIIVRVPVTVATAATTGANSATASGGGDTSCPTGGPYAANCTGTIATLPIIDAINDTDTKPPGVSGTTNVAANDQLPGSGTNIFSLFGAASTCISPAVSAAGVASYTSPVVVAGTCTVNYQVCNNSVCDNATLIVTAGAALPLQVTKNPSVLTTTPGSIISYIIGYTNPNAGTWFQNVVITDPVPLYTTFQSALCGPFPPSITSCTITAPAIGGTGTITWTLGGTLDAGSSGTVTLSVMVD